METELVYHNVPLGTQSRHTTIIPGRVLLLYVEISRCGLKFFKANKLESNLTIFTQGLRLS